MGGDILKPVHLTTEALDAGLDDIRRSPADGGRLEQIVRRPAPLERELLAEAQLDTVEGLVGDSWSLRPRVDPECQLTLMNARVAALVAVTEDRWQLAGDQLYVDLDLSRTNVPPGTRLAIGGAVIEITAAPHTGCRKFAGRFGMDAARWVNSPAGRELQLRGINARVIESGPIKAGDTIRKV